MESREKPDESNNESASHNVTKVFSSLLVSDGQWRKTGLGDQTDARSKGDRSDLQIVSLTPSEYMSQLLMTTEERMELLTKVRPVGDARDSRDYCGFEPVPNIVVFQQFSPGNVYVATLTVRNVAKVSRFLKLSCEVDPAFRVAGTSSLNTRLAAGISISYSVEFSPEENRDHEYEIKFASDRGDFAVPVIAIGARAILDFPDLVVVPETAVKTPAVKSLLVRNLGERNAAFSVSSTSPRFWLEPAKGVVEEEETVQFAVNFLSSKTGFFEDTLFLTYDTGEVVRIKVQGSAVECNVRLERGSVRMQEETYLGLSTSKTLKIFNRSEYIVKYQWMRYKDNDSDVAKKEEYKKIFGLINKAETARCVDLVHYNICTPEIHELVCQRIYGDEIAWLMKEKFAYKSSHFSLVPTDGEIWPENFVEVTVYFEPDEIGELSSTAYLEITGREERIPLSLSGLSIGPLLKLNVATIDVENIFLCSVHNFQVVCANKGFIAGVLVHRPRPSDFGGNIAVTPNHVKLDPGQHKGFNISFSSNRNGDFVERVEFVVKESLEIVALYIKGCVVCPTLHFDKTRLDFETTALGFTSKHEVTLHNDSLVPVTFTTCIPDDGVEAVVTHEDFVGAARKPSFPSSPQEFQVVPREGVVASQSLLKVKISFTPNAARAGNRILRVDMWDTDSVPVSLPIFFRSRVATLVVTPAEIDIRFCFLNYPYARTVTVENKSEVEGCFYVVPQSTLDSSSIQYSMSPHQGYLGPGQSKSVSLTIITGAMGRQKCVISMLTFGEKQPSACCVLSCNGQGPVVSVQPAALDWGDVELLRDKTLTLTLISDSPVPVEFSASLNTENSAWTVFPTSGDLSPGQSVQLQATVHLRDAGKHVDKIVVTIPRSRVILVSLSAIGIGSCVVCDPPVFPTFDMGLLFSNQDIRLPIAVTNRGSRNLKLVFASSTEVKLTHGRQVQTPTGDTFSIEPSVVELPAESTEKVFCNARSDTCGTFSEQWWLHCFFEGLGKREVIGSGSFVATFVEPSISFSKRELTFRIDMGTVAGESRRTDELFVTNESGLSLHCRLSVDEPFRMIAEDEGQTQSLKMTLREHAGLEIRVVFSPRADDARRRSKTYNGVLRLEYEEHPNADKIKCLGCVNFPSVAPLPAEIRLDCPLGCSVTENIFLNNRGPLEASYKFAWIEESVSIVRDTSAIIEKERENSSACGANDRSDDSLALSAETRDLLLGILSSFSKEEAGPSETRSLDVGPEITEEINEICAIVPCAGVVPAHSSQCVSLSFHGAQALTLEAELLCEIDEGPSELIKIFAAADDVRFSLEKERIDFGQQMIWQVSRETLKLENHSRIRLTYRVEPSGKLDESLEIRPMSGTIPARSTVELEITSQPLIPGAHENRFDLCVEHRPPISVLVEGLAVVSQVYVALPRDDIFRNYSAELGYRAVQMLPCTLDTDNEFQSLEEDERGWQLVVHDDTLPSTTDIEMAIEGLIAKRFIEETYSSMLVRSTISKHDGPIPYLFAPEYLLDMGYVIVGQSAQASTRVYNCGARGAQVRLNRSSRTEKLTKLGINIHFRDQSCLMPGEYANLDVSFTPNRLKASEKSSAVRRTFYLEVTNGFTLAITIVAIVACPAVTVDPKVLNFGEILVGECMLMHLSVKNEGPIDCQWEAKLPPTRRNQTEGPFSLRNTTDVFSPGQSGSVEIYFKPRKSGHVESALTVEIRQGQKPVIVELRGRGIEHKLRIVQPWIHFSAVLPYDSSAGQNFTVENVGQRAIEVYWQHLEQPDLQEKRVIRVLTHYYRVEEILLPPRRSPDSSALPPRLFDFYDSLVDEMILSAALQRKIDAKQEDDDVATVNNNFEEESRAKRRGSSNRKMSKKLTRTESIATAFSEANTSILSDPDVPGGKGSSLPLDDADEIEKLLHCFIDDLQKQPDFLEKMKDPVKEVFDSLENEELKLDTSFLPKKRNTCVIFHGESSTEYERAACRTARCLELPLWNLNSAITETIALGNTACSAKIREIVDSKYRELLTASEKSPTGETSRIFSVEELSAFDSLTRYEYEIEAIRSSGTGKAVSVVGSSPRAGKGSAKGKKSNPQTPRAKSEETFLDIDHRLLVELLEQRLSTSDLSRGFVLDSLKNSFIKSEEKTLASLLQILGDVEYPIFVTFHKSHDVRKSDNKMLEESIDATVEKLMQIDEMSSSEFDLLSETDKKLYRDGVLLARSQEALQRRMEFQRRISEIRKQKDQSRRRASRNGKGKNAGKRRSKILPQSSRVSERLTAESPSKKKSAKVDSAKSSARKTAAEEIEAIDVNKAETDPSSLESILSILETWDPTGKSIDPNHKETGRSKMQKNAKRGRPSTALSKTAETNNRFWIWHVKTDLRDSTPDEDIILNEMKRNKSLLNPELEVPSVKIEPVLRSQIYSVVQPSKSTAPVPEIGARGERAEVFDLVALRCGANLSSEIPSRDEQASSEILEEPLEPRLVLQPHESRLFRAYFRPKRAGFFQQEFPLIILNSNGSSHGIQVNGSADIPRVNMEPSLIFRKIKEAKKDDMNDSAYFADIRTFDFGSLLLTDKDNKVHRKKTSFKFWNPSKMDLELKISLLADNWRSYDAEPKQLMIKPNECGIVVVTAVAEKIGPNEDQLVLLMTGNPRVEFIHMRSNGAKLDVELEGKQMSFGRVFKHREVTKPLRVRNGSLVPIYWRINPVGPVDPQIKFSPPKGWIKARSETNVLFTYLANSIGVTDKKSMAFRVFLNEDDDGEDALFKDIVTVTGETYDVTVDVDSATPIALGTVIVGSVASTIFTIKNRGPYDVNYTIDFEKNDNYPAEINRDLRKNLREDLHVLPSTGTVGADKITTVNVNFQPKFEMRLREIPLLRCNLIDPNDSATPVAEFPLTVSIASHYVRFRLIPESEISFGPLGVCTAKTLHLGIENTGQFLLRYQLKNAILPAASEDGSRKQKREKSARTDTNKHGTAKSARTDTNKHGTAKSREAAASLRVGPFTCPKSEGVVTPGDTETLRIVCYPEAEGRVEEKILVSVEDCPPDVRPGRSVRLNVDSCLPSIDFDDLDAIFQDGYLVDEIRDFVCPEGVDAHTVFARDERCLHFRSVVIHKTHTAAVRLYNRGAVPARVTVSLRPDASTPKNAKSEAFALDTVEETVAPMSSHVFAVSFTPALIETYSGVLEAVVELPAHLRTDAPAKLSIRLSGEGCVPEVTLVEPPTSLTRAENPRIGFGRCLVRETSSRELVFKNIGRVTARVIVEIEHDDEMLYAFRACEDDAVSATGIRIGDSDEDRKTRSVVRSLWPEETARYLVEFRPNEVGTTEARIRLRVLDNPYENTTVELVGEGFMENVVLVGLPIVETSRSGTADYGHVRSRKSTKHRGSSASSLSTIALQTAASASAPTYSLDFDACFVNKMRKIVFKIVNKSGERCFRFQLSAHPNVVFAPSVGHLQRRDSKDVVATFFTTEPIAFGQLRLDCEIHEISYPEERGDEASSWDDRQTSAEWISDDADETTHDETSTRKIAVPSAEPGCEIVAGTARIIRLMFSAVAAFSEYSCPIEEINFKDTLMFQSREFSFVVENSGSVDVLFNWKIEMDVEHSKRLADGDLRAAQAFRSRSSGSNESRPSSRSSDGILYPEAERRSVRYIYSRNRRDGEEIPRDSNLVDDYRSLSSRDNLSAIDVEPYASNGSDLFSDSAARTQRSTDSWIEAGDDQPFSVKPACGKIPAGQSPRFALRFSPLDVFDYRANLTCQMENLHPNLEPLRIAATGRSLLPYCHFDVEESSDYPTRSLQGQRNNPDDGSGDSRESTLPRVVEFRVVGTGESHEREFHLINPTTDNYRFTWEDITTRGPEELPYFRCIREVDLAQSGKRTSVKFAFFASETGVFESLWRFSIDRYDLDTVFLLVAVVTEPAVRCVDARLRMKPSVLGSRVEDTVIIVNDEDSRLPFKILPDSLRSVEDSLQALVVAPMAGILQPKSRQILQVSFVPSNVGEFTFPLQCQVKSMKSPLSVVVTARAGRIIPRVLYSCGPKGQRMLETHRDNRETVLDFGKLTPSEPSAVKFEIANIGDVVFHYNWDLGPKDPGGAYSLAVTRETDLVLSESVSTCYLELTVARGTAIRRHPVTLKISNGPEYYMCVKTSTKHPSIEFNFVEYDFGPRYIRDVDAPAYTAHLTLTNNDKTPAIVECDYAENSPHMSVDLQVLSQAIPGHSSVTLPISFRPLQQQRYTESLNFRVNDSSVRQTVVVKGEGMAYKICLENSRDRYVELGHVPVGKTVTRKIRVLNVGRAPVKISFDLVKSPAGCEKNHRPPTAGRDEAVARSREAGDSRQPRDIEENAPTLRDVLTVEPRDAVSLPANRSVEVIVRFTPTERIDTFVEKIGAWVDSTMLPLFFLRGSCVAREFRLSRSQLYFGTVVEGCSSETKLALQNTGDFGARFKWHFPKFTPHFDLHPTSGYCSPGANVTFTVTFRPVQLAPLLEAEAVVDLEKHASLRLSCSGACCRMPDPVETLKFSVPVRTAQTRDLTITNDSNVAWNVTTILSGDFFHTDERFSVPAKKSHSCSVTYAPLVMNSEKNVHRGKLLVELPDDRQPLVFSLVGLSLPPVVEAKVERQLPAKTKYTELLPVHNWLDRPQSFRCDIKLVDDLKATPVLHSFTGNSKLDVPAGGTRDFRASFYCYKEGTLNFRITFTNDDGEYEFYEVRYRVSKPDVLSTLKLATSARSSTRCLLPVDNPLEDRSVSFTANCQHREITIQGVPKVVPAKKSDNIVIVYSPLLPGEGVARLEVNCADLGSFPYELKLKATAAPPEKINRVTATLGSSTTFPIVIGNSSDKSAEFFINVDDPSFTCDRSVTVPPRKESIVEITYEPCDARNVTATLTAVSETLGEFIFPLIGSYTLPKPRGPLTVSPNSPLSIVFKNVFTTTKTFECIVDRPADFVVATPSVAVESKKVATIVVRFDGSSDQVEESQGGEYPVTGKLLVSCAEPAFSHIVWVFYLRGVRE